MNKLNKQQIHLSALISLLLTLCLLTMSQYSHASDRKILWPRWQVNNPLSDRQIDHQLWQEFLSSNMITNDEHINLVDYARISAPDQKKLSHYLGKMSKVAISQYSRSEQLAYWINLYNALTIKLIIDHYPVLSIRDINISPGLFSVGPWSASLIRIENVALSLNDIHNRIIRPIWNDPRTHYAINNATIGAPNLSNTPYNGEKINQQLNEASSQYINCLRGVQIIDDKLIVSKIYDWFEQDFGGNKQYVIQHISLYAKPKMAKQLKNIHTINGYLYNWHLNNAIHGRKQTTNAQ